MTPSQGTAWFLVFHPAGNMKRIAGCDTIRTACDVQVWD